jgi:hypothetical protein
MASLNILSIILIFIGVLSSACQAARNKSIKKCTRELQGIIHKPSTCALSYLEGLAEKFKVGSPIIFTSQVQANAYILTFANTYGIDIGLIPTFGDQTVYTSTGSQTETSLPMMFSTTAQSYLNFGGFVNAVGASSFYYKFRIFSRDGQQYGVSLMLSNANTPIGC